MKLENQVCTQQHAKRLSELGIDGSPSLYNWLQDWDNDGNWCVTSISADGAFPAFTVAELGEMLPERIQYANRECFISSEKNDRGEIKWEVGIFTVAKKNNATKPIKYLMGKTEAEARASLLIFLLETKFITVEEVNQRLAA